MCWNHIVAHITTFWTPNLPSSLRPNLCFIIINVTINSEICILTKIFHLLPDQQNYVSTARHQFSSPANGLNEDADAASSSIDRRLRNRSIRRETRRRREQGCLQHWHSIEVICSDRRVSWVRDFVTYFLRVPQLNCSCPAAQASMSNSQKIGYKTSSPSTSPAL